MPGTMRRVVAASAAVAVFAGVVANALAESTADEIAKYRDALQDGNPAELWEARGEEMWKTQRGPAHVSFAACDLGLGAGVVKGAYAQLPRYFADAGRVMDLETRLVWCMVNQQGYAPADATKTVFGNGSAKRSDLEALAAYVASQSRGVKMHVPLDEPHVHDMFRLGEKMFFYRAGTHDFACATCHGHPNLRIRLQDLPNLTDPKDAQRAYTTWPGYRVSQGEVRTMQHRLNDCYRQQRFPEPGYASDAVTALTMYLAVNANGGKYNGPAVKR